MRRDQFCIEVQLPRDAAAFLLSTCDKIYLWANPIHAAHFFPWIPSFSRLMAVPPPSSPIHPRPEHSPLVPRQLPHPPPAPTQPSPLPPWPPPLPPPWPPLPRQRPQLPPVRSRRCHFLSHLNGSSFHLRSYHLCLLPHRERCHRFFFRSKPHLILKIWTIRSFLRTPLIFRLF